MRASTRNHVLSLALVIGCLGLPLAAQEGAPTAAPAVNPLAAAANAQGLPDSLAKLLPKGAVMVIAVTSVDEAEGAAKKAVGSIDEREARRMSMRPMLDPIVSLGIDLDRSKPLAFAMTLPSVPEEEPGMIFVVPVKDVEKTKAALAEKQASEAVVWDGSYVGLGSMGPYEAGGAPSFLPSKLPQGQLMAFADLAAVADFYRPLIDQGLQEASEFMELIASGAEGAEGLGSILESMIGGCRNFVSEVGTLEAYVAAKGAEVEFIANVQPRKGKTISAGKYFPGTDLSKLLGTLRGGEPLTVAGGMAMEHFWAFYEKLFASMVGMLGDQEAAKFKDMVAQMMPLVKNLGPGFAFGMAFGDKGMEMSGAYECADPSSYMTQTEKLFEGESMKAFGVKSTEIQKVEVAGTKAVRMNIELDMETFGTPEMAGLSEEQRAQIVEMQRQMMKTMFGGEKLAVGFAPGPKMLVMALGADQALLERAMGGAGSPAKLSPSLTDALAKAGSKPGFLMHMELRSFLGQIFSMMGPMMPGEAPPSLNPKGPQAPATIFLSQAGQGFRFGVMADLGGIGAMAKELRSPR